METQGSNEGKNRVWRIVRLLTALNLPFSALSGLYLAFLVTQSRYVASFEVVNTSGESLFVRPVGIGPAPEKVALFTCDPPPFHHFRDPYPIAISSNSSHTIFYAWEHSNLSDLELATQAGERFLLALEPPYAAAYRPTQYDRIILPPVSQLPRLQEPFRSAGDPGPSMAFFRVLFLWGLANLYMFLVSVFALRAERLADSGQAARVAKIDSSASRTEP